MLIEEGIAWYRYRMSMRAISQGESLEWELVWTGWIVSRGVRKWGPRISIPCIHVVHMRSIRLVVIRSFVVKDLNSYLVVARKSIPSPETAFC